MKRSAPFLQLTGDFLLLSCGVLGALLCPLTALNLPYDSGTLAAGCLLLSLLAALWTHLFRWQWPLLLLTLGGVVLCVWLLGDSLQLTVLQLASAALDAWRPTYLWLGSFSWEPASSATAEEAAAVYMLLAAIFAALLGHFVLHQHSIFPAFLLTLPSLILSMAGEDAVPEPWALFLLTGFWLGAILNRDLRRNQDRHSALAALLLPCAALVFLAGLYYVLEPETWSRPAEATDAQRAVTQTMAELSEISWDDFTDATNADDSSRQMSDVHLDELDGGSASSAVMLRVRSSYTGQLYLRGYSLVDYADNTWSIAGAGTDYADYLELYMDADAEGTVEVRAVQDSSGLLYTVYGLCGDLPDGAVLLGDYAISRQDSTWSLQVSGALRAAADTAYADSVWNGTDYLQIGMDEADLEALTAIALEAISGLSGSISADEAAAAVALYVSGSAVYDLDTPANPEGTDFVLYFLQESQQGYCVHFASATTLLLRALGIPARYVTGYTVSVTEADTWTDVTAADAHAWTEYFNGSVWVPLESTPGQTSPDLPASSEEEEDTPAAPASSSTDTEQTAEDDTDSMESGEAAEPESAAETDTAEMEQVSSAADRPFLPLLSLLLLLALAAAVLLRRQLILKRRQKQFHASDPGQAFVAMWKYLLKLERRGITPDRPMIALAEKARFSREGATREDCAALEDWMQAKIRALYRQSSPARRVLLRYIFVLEEV